MLIGRSSRKTRFLRIGPDGSVILDSSLDKTMAEEGLTKWTDFSSSQNQLILFGALGTRKDQLNQGFVSRIDIPDGDIVTRLAPLSQLGLKAAKNSSDEGSANLEHYPAHRPQMLTSLAGKPLTVSLIYQSRREALQLDESTKKLAIYTEARDERRARADKKAQRKQRKADRKKRKQQLSSDMAGAVGMSPEEYAALSNKERKNAMIRYGDMNAMMGIIAKQSQMAQKEMAKQQAGGMPTMPQGMPQGIPPEMAAAMKQAQQAMAKAGMTLPNIPNVSNMQKTPSTPDAPAAASGFASDSVADTTASNKILKVDAGKRGFIEFENPDNKFTTLVILDRQTGKELLKKKYSDGVIYEYLDFNRFNLPLARISVFFKDASGQTLKELTPAVLP